MRYAGGISLRPVQTLVDTIIFALRAKMHIESTIPHHKKTNPFGSVFLRVWAFEGLIRKAAPSDSPADYRNQPGFSPEKRIRPPPPNIADLRQKIGDVYFFTITYSRFSKSTGRFLEVISNSE